MPQNFYELVWIFIIYAFIGWCTEVSYAGLDQGTFVNRGFLNGPYCPIYGCGVVIVVAILTPLKENLFILFVGSVILTTILEYITGFILEKAFHNKWWDYSDKPFNIKGYVCLKFSIYWGLACTFIMEIIHPIIYKCINVMPFIVGVIILSIIMAAFIVDLFVTVSTILKFNKRLKLMNEVAEKIHALSDEIGENIYENVATAIEKSEEFQENHEELISKINEKKEDIMDMPGNAKAKIAETTENAKSRITERTENTINRISETTENTITKLSETTEVAKNKIAETTEVAMTKISETTEAAKAKITETAETTKQKLAESVMESKSEAEYRREEKRKEREELRQKYNELFEKKNFGFKRLMKAFPDMSSRDQNETLQKYKNYFNIKKTKEKQENKNDQNN